MVSINILLLSAPVARTRFSSLDSSQSEDQAPGIQSSPNADPSQGRPVSILTSLVAEGARDRFRRESRSEKRHTATAACGDLQPGLGLRPPALTGTAPPDAAPS